MYTIPENLTTLEPPTTEAIADEILSVLTSMGIDLDSYGFKRGISNEIGTNKGRVALRTPITGESYGSVKASNEKEISTSVGNAQKAFDEFKVLPAPVRGQFVRILGEYLREYKNQLGFLVSVEVGKIVSEGLGEVQEMIDIADLAVGQSRQLFGKTIASERPQHSMRETWHPLGVIGVITAFNFPVAVWAWNSCIAFVCGDPVVFKPSDKTSLTAIVIHELAKRAARECGIDENVSQLVLGGVEPSVQLAKDERIALLSVTGSVAAGAALSPIVASRLGKSLLELGGNNAMIVAPSADLDLAVRAITFAAAGTAGQRCTTLRRVIAHESIKDELVTRIKNAYSTFKVGNPLCPEVLIGPLITGLSSEALDNATAPIKVTSSRYHDDSCPNSYYRHPVIGEVDKDHEMLKHETFAPLLYVTTYIDIEDAIEQNNHVPQGLSSSIFTTDVREAELFLSTAGSDCGMANVNIGPSGAEIGGAFGGEKQTGGGREAGSDAWKIYMRRATNTVNYGDALPLAQGVEF